MTMPLSTDLYRRSTQIILENQSSSGAYIASPNFPTYHYCWFRDGAFIAYAMDLAGEHDSASRFHEWAASVINCRAEIAPRAVELANRGKPLSGADILHTRYKLNGEDDLEEAWPNFQLDGFGAWLWAVSQHLEHTGRELPKSWAQAADLVAQYLSALWQRPCYDCWEEFPDKIHAHTLAAIYGGLEAHAQVSGCDHTPTLSAISSFIQEEITYDGHFAKFAGSTEVDASLIGLATPYRVFDPHNGRMRATAARIELDLARHGGVHRYAKDTYYGGGEWVLLAGWLGWYFVEAGQPHKALRLLQWMEAQAGPDGSLPEQAPASLNAPEYYEGWVQRWGPIANPLLWSHAKYIILKKKLAQE